MSEEELARIETWAFAIPGRGAADMQKLCVEVRRSWLECAQLKAELERLQKLAVPPSLGG